MTVYFNNSAISTDSSTLKDLIHEKGLHDKKGIAVAINNAVVSKETWQKIKLNKEDNILIITATQGG